MGPEHKLIMQVRKGDSMNSFSGGHDEPGIRLSGCMLSTHIRRALLMPKVIPVVYSPYDANGNGTAHSAGKAVRRVSDEVCRFYETVSNFGVAVNLARTPEMLEELLKATDGVERVIVAHSFMRNPEMVDGFSEPDYHIAPIVKTHVWHEFDFDKRTGLYLINHEAELDFENLRRVIKADKPCYFLETRGEVRGFRKIYK